MLKSLVALVKEPQPPALQKRTPVILSPPASQLCTYADIFIFFLKTETLDGRRGCGKASPSIAEGGVHAVDSVDSPSRCAQESTKMAVFSCVASRPARKAHVTLARRPPEGRRNVFITAALKHCTRQRAGIGSLHLCCSAGAGVIKSQQGPG